jgi:hypothetical protein
MWHGPVGPYFCIQTFGSDIYIYEYTSFEIQMLYMSGLFFDDDDDYFLYVVT